MSFGLDQVDDLCGVFLFFRQIINGDIGAFTGVGNGHRAADTGVTAGNQRFFARQAAVTFIARFPVIGNRLHLRSQSWWRLRLFRERGFYLDNLI